MTREGIEKSEQADEQQGRKGRKERELTGEWIERLKKQTKSREGWEVREMN